MFLDEVGDLPLALQPKLLRLLQEKRYERVGETQTRASDVRILAATNRDLAVAVSAGQFREDLLYRLNVIEVTLPPLRSRQRNILPLADHLLYFFARQSGKPPHPCPSPPLRGRGVGGEGFTEEARMVLNRYPWPGNVRELRNAIERGVILASGEQIGLADLPAQVGSPPLAQSVEVGGRMTLDQMEAEHIRRVLAATPTIEEAATVLGIDPSTLYRKRKRFGL